jgi:hypothetical protein
VAAHAASIAAGGEDVAAATRILQPYVATPQQQQRAETPATADARLQRRISHARSLPQLLELLQAHAATATADSLTSVLRQASLLTKAAAAAGSSPSRQATAAADAAAAQQLVSLALHLLLGLSDQVGGWQLSNCLLSLAMLCGRGGPAAAAMAGADGGTAVAAGAGAVQQQQQQQQQPPSTTTSTGMLAQLVLGSNSSVRDLETLLHATGPQHQLQSLLEACRSTAVASAQPYQLVNLTYSLAVLLMRPAPAVLSALLWGLQEHLEAAATAVRPGLFSPKQLSQLLWAAATLQLPLSPGWLQRYWAASQPLLAQYGAQDVANTTWALARLKRQQQQEEEQQQQHQAGSSYMAAQQRQQRQQCQPPPAWLSDLQQQAVAVADSMTAQGVANTLWGLAVLDAHVEPGLLLRLLQRGLKVGHQLQPQPLANLVWGATRCLCSSTHGSPQPTSAAAAAAKCRQLLEAILAQCAPRLGRQLLPIDWCNIMWAAGQARLHPSPALLAALWHKTPAGFSTSLNPHQPGSSGGSSRGTLSPARWCPQALAVTLWGCARLGIRPPPVWLQGFEVAAVPLLAVFSHQQLANTLWGFGELRVAPSDAWLLLFWRQADGIAARLALAAAAASGAAGGWPHARAKLLHSLQHAVMLLQACGWLGLLPPAGWMDQVLPALPAAAAALQQQEQDHRVLRTLSAAVQVLGGMARLQQREQQGDAAVQQAADSEGAAAAVAGQQLLQLMGLLTLGATRTTSSSSSAPLAGLQGPDALLLLTALPRLQLEPQSQLLPAAAALLPVAHRSLQHYSGSEAAQVAAAVAGIAHHCRGGSSSSGLPNTAAPTEVLWARLAAYLQEEGEGQRHASSAAAAAGVFLGDLSRVLLRHVSTMNPSDLSTSLAAVSALHQAAAGNSSRHSRQLVAASSGKLPAPAAVAVSSFVAAAGNAVGTHMQHLSPYQRSLAAASLARLGFRPSPAWLQELLRHSAWEFGSSSNGELLRLLLALPVLLRQQMPAAPAPHSQQQQLLLMVRGWLADWSHETEPHLEALSSGQLVAAAKALTKLDQQLSAAAADAASLSARAAGSGHQLQHHSRLQVPCSWAAQLLHTCTGRLQQLTPGELLALLGAAKSLRLEPRHDWCAAVAEEGAAQAGAALAQLSGTYHQQEQQVLHVHHVGLLAYGLRRLGYIPAWQQQSVLLQYVAAACNIACVAAAASLPHQQHQRQRVVAPRQLWQLLVLLALCSWRPERAWVQQVQQSAAGRRLRAWLGQRPQRDSWEQVWGRLVVWEDVPGRRTAQREQRARLAAVLADERRGRGDRGVAAF